VHFLACDRAMLDALRDDEQFAGAERHGAVAQLDVEHTFKHQEEIVGLVVLVPDELAFELRHHHVVTVVGRDRARREVIAERRELLGEIDPGHCGLLRSLRLRALA
jgi:hypothetical protein